MNLSVIIVSWNVREKLQENLQALFESVRVSGCTAEVFVVDNASVDKTVEMVESEFPSVKIIKNKENLGFAKANNQAIKRSRGDYVLLLNPDMRVRTDTIKNMKAWMDSNKKASLAGCRLVDEKGEIVEQVRRFPKILDQLAIILKLPHLFPSVLNKYLRKGFDYEKESRVDSLRGGFFFLRRDTLERIGLLDERFFLWFEEVDYCRRVIDKRYGGFAGEVWYTPAAECVDYVGQSFKQLKRGKTQKYFRDSQLKYFKKWHPIWQYWLLKLAWPFGASLAKIGEKLTINSRAKT
ncbi:glycosyltransferase family 2 protein [bacterium]|nr:glycosyltransferase family 2 protein [bacterium]